MLIFENILLIKTKNTEKSVEFLLHIKEEEIKPLISFLGKTDFIFKRDNRNSIQGFLDNNLRDMLFLVENKELRENFFPQFLVGLEEYKNKISNNFKELFEYVTVELTQGHQYLSLSNNLDKKLTKDKKIKYN